jgi:hypothetical protein
MVSLVVIEKMFGTETMMKVKEEVNYPHARPKMEHQSQPIDFNNKLTIANKVLFGKNRRIGVLLQNGIGEFDLAGVIDTYNRTFPGEIESFLMRGSSIRSKFGLTILPTGSISTMKLDELHVINPSDFSQVAEKHFEKIEIVKYDRLEKVYIIDYCLKRIRNQYGPKFEHITKLLLDYN